MDKMLKFEKIQPTWYMPHKKGVQETHDERNGTTSMLVNSFNPLKQFDLLDKFFAINDSNQAKFPRSNIYINGSGQLIFEFALAGYKKTEVDIQIDNNKLTVSGKATSRENKYKDEGIDNMKVFHQGIAFRSFSVSYALPNVFLDADAAADFEDGILTIQLNKKPELDTKKRIEIK